MRFLYVAPRFHPNQYPIMKGLISKDHEVMFCVSKVGSTEKHDGIRVKTVKPSAFSRGLYKLFSRKGESYAENKMTFWFLPEYREVKRCIAEFKPDVMIVRDWSLLAASFVRAGKKHKQIKLLEYNQSPVYAEPVGGLKGFLKRLWLRQFPRKRITVCRYKVYPFAKNGLIEDKNAYFLPFVARQKIKGDRDYLKEGTVNIFDCGKFRPYKNHAVLIDALAILRDKGYSNFRATILGQADNTEEKAYFQVMEDKIRQYGLEEHITLKTSVPYDEMPHYYLENDIFVLASARELANVSILDAMSYGLATISTSMNGTADYIEIGKTGFVFKTNDAQDLSEKLEHYLKNPELAQIHGRRAMEEVTGKYRFDAYYQKFMKIIEEL